MSNSTYQVGSINTEDAADMADIAARIAENKLTHQQRMAMFGGTPGHTGENFVRVSTPWSDGAPVATSDREHIPGSMAVGHGAGPQEDGLVEVGGYRTTVQNAENLRRGMSAQEWLAATGLPYQPLSTLSSLRPQDHAWARQAQPESQQQQPQQAAAEQQAAAQEKVLEAEIARNTIIPSAIETLVEQHFPPIVGQTLADQFVATGEADPKFLADHGLQQSWVKDAIKHHTEQVVRILEPMGVTLPMLTEGLEEADLTKVRRAIVNRDSATIKKYGEAARANVSKWNGQKLQETLDSNTMKALNLKIKPDGYGTVTINGYEMSWVTAVSSGYIKL
jgi:hypothetical protein